MSIPGWLVAKPIAHRGLHNKENGIVENTISAAEAAIARGFPIECDVQLTADGEAVVFHDFDLDRLTGETGKVVDRTLSQLTGIAVAGSASDKIPSLKGFLDRVAERVPLVIEIKSLFDGDMRLTQRVCEIVADYGGPFVIKSFDPAIVATVRRIAPGITRGIVSQARFDHPSEDYLSAEVKHNLTNLLHFSESQPQFLSWRVRDIRTAPPYLCKVLGQLPVMTWTVRTPEERDSAEKYADQMVFEGFVP
jgi:glycerophosphoryl diester phosphodiesterase